MQLRSFDAFPKVDVHYTQRSATGGMLSVVVAFLIALLTFSEFHHYMHPPLQHEFLVDNQVDGTLQINFDVTVKMRCEYISVDVLDAAGDAVHLDKKIRKTPTLFTAVGAKHFRENGGWVYSENVKDQFWGLRKHRDVDAVPERICAFPLLRCHSLV